MYKSNQKIENEFHEVFGEKVSPTNPEIVQLFTLIVAEEVVIKSQRNLQLI